jgi:hypothetical protein
MKLTISLEMAERGPTFGTGTSVVAGTDDFSKRDDSPQRDMSYRTSANFVTQVAATFLRFPQTCARRRADLRDGIRIYDHAVAARLIPAGAAIYRKT